MIIRDLCSGWTSQAADGADYGQDIRAAGGQWLGIFAAYHRERGFDRKEESKIRCGWDLETLDFQTSWLHEAECFMFSAEVHQSHEQRTNWTSSRKPIRSANTQRRRHTSAKSKQTLWGVLATSKKQSTKPTFALTLDLTNLRSQPAPLKNVPNVLCETCSKLTQHVARWRLTEQISLEQRQCRRMERELEAGSWKCWTQKVRVGAKLQNVTNVEFEANTVQNKWAVFFGMRKCRNEMELERTPRNTSGYLLLVAMFSTNSFVSSINSLDLAVFPGYNRMLTAYNCWHSKEWLLKD